MGRHCSIQALGTAKISIVDQVIRDHGYIQLDDIVGELAQREIKLARSTLHRYLRELRQRDLLCATPEEGTIVTIVERATGEVRVVKCRLPGSILFDLIRENASHS